MSTAEVPETETPETEQPADPEVTEPETDTPDEPETDTPDTPDTDDPSIEAQLERLQERDKKLEKERALHEKRLAALHGDDWDAHVMCPLCVGDGFLTPYGPGDLPAEQLDAMDALSGRYTPPEYVDDASYTKCEHCQGWGKTITGSQNPEHITKLCDKCSGNGYVQKLYVVPPAAPAPAPGSPAAVNGQPPVSYGAPVAPDQWGRPAGHAHYGIEPQFVTA